MSLKCELIENRRVIGLDGREHICEGQAAELHKCAEGYHMNEVFVTRRPIMKIKDAEKRAHFMENEINCSILCGYYHLGRGNSKQFKRVFYALQLERYGIDAMNEWFEKADKILKISVEKIP